VFILCRSWSHGYHFCFLLGWGGGGGLGFQTLIQNNHVDSVDIQILSNEAILFSYIPTAMLCLGTSYKCLSNSPFNMPFPSYRTRWFKSNTTDFYSGSVDFEYWRRRQLPWKVFLGFLLTLHANPLIVP
jgi:hypothetical protein